MPKLDEKVKIYVVQLLACYQTPSQIAEAVKADFGLVLQRNNIQAYDPTKVQGRSLSKQLAEIFWETRAKFKQEVSEIAIANQAYRLLILQQALERAIARKNDVLVLDILEQAAKDLGGMFNAKSIQRDGTAVDFLQNFYRSISGTTLPVVPDEELEPATVDQAPQDLSKPKEAQNKKQFLGRD